MSNALSRRRAPACVAMSSSTPGSRVVRLGRRVGRARRQERPHDRLHRLEVVALVRSPDLDHHRRARLGDTAGLAQRGDHVVGEEERVEAGDEVEAVVLVRERLHVAHAQVRIRQPALRASGDQRLGGVDARTARAPRSATRRRNTPTPQPTSSTRCPGSSPTRSQRRLVGGELLLLAVAPSRRAGRPRAAPSAPRSRAVRRCRVLEAMSAPLVSLCFID